MSNLAAALTSALAKATKEFTTEKRKAAAHRVDYVDPAQIDRMREREKKKKEELTIKKAAFKVMAKAYALASDNGTLPANGRQIMYAARPMVLALTGGKCWEKSSYFTQTLLNDYQDEYPKQTASWDVVYDARGHLTEPHVRSELGLGTLEVRSYFHSWRRDLPEGVDFNFEELCPTQGPYHRYKYALFVEKEGFDPLLERSQIAERYDLAIFSSKGVSSTAARQLVDALAGAGVTILLLHDFDTYGLTIAYTLTHDTERYQFNNRPNVIDLGLRLSDVKAMNLQSEPVEYDQQKDPRTKFRKGNWFDAGYNEYNQDYDVTEKELDFLVERRVSQGYKPSKWVGKWVELNAMTSRQFINWLERKLEKHGVEKVVPEENVLAAGWRRARRISRIREAIAEIDEEAAEDDADENFAPPDLERRVRALLKKQPTLSWDAAVVQIASELGK